MLAIWVKVRVKPEGRQRFLQAIEQDALGSGRDEPGCLRFNVLQDEKDPNVYYFFEVYKDAAALEEHRKAPHYATWRAAADTLDGPTEPTRCQTVFPSQRACWGEGERYGLGPEGPGSRAAPDRPARGHRARGDRAPSGV